MPIEVIRVDADNPNRRRRWGFWHTGTFLLLHSFETQSRATPRHKWRRDEAIPYYDHWRRGTRDRLPLDDVPLPDDVQETARATLMSQLKVVKELP